MILLFIFICILFLISILTFTVSYICYRIAFYSNRKKKVKSPIGLPSSKAYDPYRETISEWINDFKNAEYIPVEITSFDGLVLRGRYYEQKENAPIELMFHGYRSTAERDLSGGIKRCFSIGHNALIVDQRASGKSEGHTITFGINESRDCLDWISFIKNRFGNDIKIILTGISMGAATVLTASGETLPENVVAILADCGFSSAKDIIKKVIKDMHLPPDIIYPFIKLGAKLFGHFNLEEKSAIKSMETCRTPIIFIHGEKDSYVPCSMSKEIYDSCKSKKKLLIVKNAEHGLSYVVSPNEYINEISIFFDLVYKDSSAL